ncbi:hypothetical protein BDZ91DRAFT_768784 [Kalaharituber pfeilii]|nr:hypothetical protein BDZ91DRAFT_768784 [Kalaharituber pfeilii]
MFQHSNYNGRKLPKTANFQRPQTSKDRKLPKTANFQYCHYSLLSPQFKDFTVTITSSRKVIPTAIYYTAFFWVTDANVIKVLKASYPNPTMLAQRLEVEYLRFFESIHDVIVQVLGPSQYFTTSNTSLLQLCPISSAAESQEAKARLYQRYQYLAYQHPSETLGLVHDVTKYYNTYQDKPHDRTAPMDLVYRCSVLIPFLALAHEEGIRDLRVAEDTLPRTIAAGPALHEAMSNRMEIKLQAVRDMIATFERLSLVQARPGQEQCKLDTERRWFEDIELLAADFELRILVWDD